MSGAKQPVTLLHSLEEKTTMPIEFISTGYYTVHWLMLSFNTGMSSSIGKLYSFSWYFYSCFWIHSRDGIDLMKPVIYCKFITHCLDTWSLLYWDLLRTCAGVSPGLWIQYLPCGWKAGNPTLDHLATAFHFTFPVYMFLKWCLSYSILCSLYFHIYNTHTS